MKTQTKTPVQRYQELHEEHMDLMSPCSQSEIDRAAEIQREQASLEREFPGTLSEWMELDS